MTSHLFHYTSSESAKIILNSGTLLAGKIFESNDPFEDIELNFYEETLDPETVESLDNDIKYYMREIVRFLSFSNGDYSKWTRAGKQYIEPKKRPGFFYPRMWGQYGDHHKGVCLVFDKDRLSEQVQDQIEDEYEIMQGEIDYIDILSDKYSNDIFDIFDIDFCKFKQKKVYSYVDLFLQQYRNNLYFAKDSDWKNEQEYRFLIYNKPLKGIRDRLFLSFGDSLIAIVLGIRFDQQTYFYKTKAREYDANLIELNRDGALIIINYD